MKALIVYDSVYGNTEKIAQSVGRAFGPGGDAKTLRVGEVKPEHLAGLDVLIVGSPTQKFTALPAIKKFLAGIPENGLKGVRVAAFDTRISMKDTKSRFLHLMVKLFGYAAEPLARRLVKKGGEEAVPPEGFFVDGTKGPIKAGELDRAAAWAGRIAARP